MSHAPAPLPDAVEAFLASREMAPVTFGRLAMRDPHFVRDLRGGRRVWPETEQKVRSFMDEYQPTPQTAEAA